jgi:hypothetical protein
MDVELMGLDFSNTVTKSQIEEMATVDEYEVVKEVQVSYTSQSSSGSRQRRRRGLSLGEMVWKLIGP